MSKKANQKRRERREERRKEKKLKLERNKKIVLIVAAVCVVAILAVAIVAALPHYAKIKYVDGKYRDSDTGITYLAAPQNYEPVSYTQKPYGKLDDHYMYPITGMDTDNWLAEDYYGIFAVYYNEEISLPTLENFSACRIQVCRDGAESVVRVATIDSEEDVQKIVSAMLQGEEVTLPDVVSTVYTLRISSSEYTWLYYNIVYVVTEEGNFYYDRGLNRVVKADDTVSAYLENNVLEE